MTPLPEESTARYIVHYTSVGNEHVQQWRVGSPISPTTFQTFLISFWDALDAVLLSATITGVGFIADGSTIENPVVMGTFVGSSYGSGTGSNIQGTGFLDFVGRSSGGKRIRVATFSPNLVDESFRLHIDENTHIATAHVVLSTNTVDLVAIDGIAPVWKPYANWGYNAHWQRARRS